MNLQHHGFLHLVPLKHLRVGDVVVGRGTREPDNSVAVATVAVWQDGEALEFKAVVSNWGSLGTTYVTFGPVDTGQVTHSLDDNNDFGPSSMALVPQATYDIVKRRAPCSKCGRSG